VTSVGEKSRFSVAGIPFVHDAPPGVPVPQWITPAWEGSRVVDEPIRIYHEIGDTGVEGLRPVIATSLPQGEYFVDSSRNMAIRARGEGPHVDRPQLLRTRRRGFDYTIRYDRVVDTTRMQWGWHRTIFMFALPLRRRGLSVHATGFVLPNGSGVVCPGVSGAGKSTLARTLVAGGIAGLTVVGDDRIAVTAERGSLHLWGTPWHSAAGTAVAADAPCRAVVFMRRGEGVTVARLPARDASRRLIRTVAIPFWDDDATGFALEMIDRMVTELPCFDVAYAPGGTAAETIVNELLTALTTNS
jgi:hypothetical protein